MSKKTQESALREPGISDENGFRGESPDRTDSRPVPLGSAPTAAEAEKAAVAASKIPEAPAAAEPPKVSVPLRIFASTVRLKPDQFAGFAAYAQREGFRACPVAEWHARLGAFRTRPTKSNKR